MRIKLLNISKFQSGVYEKPELQAEVLYLQAVHFTRSGTIDKSIPPRIKLTNKLQKYILEDGDLLFAAKGMNNFAVVYKSEIGKAVASSSFIVIKINKDKKLFIQPDYLAWFITHHKQIKLMQQQQLGTTIPSISMAQLGDMDIDIPSIATQKKIVAIHQLREREKELTLQIEEWKDREIQLLLSSATKK